MIWGLHNTCSDERFRQVSHLAWLGLAWLGLAWLSLAWALGEVRSTGGNASSKVGRRTDAIACPAAATPVGASRTWNLVLAITLLLCGRSTPRHCGQCQKAAMTKQATSNRGTKILPAQMHTQTILAGSVKDLSLDFRPVRRGEAPYPRWVPGQLSEHFPITAIRVDQLSLPEPDFGLRAKVPR